MKYIGMVVALLVLVGWAVAKWHPRQKQRRRERLELRILARLMLERAGAEELDYLFEFWNGTSFLYDMVDEKLISRKEMLFQKRDRRFHYRYYYEITSLGQKRFREHLRRYALPRTMIVSFDDQGVN